MRVTGSATIDKMVREIFSVALTYELTLSDLSALTSYGSSQWR